VAFRVVCRPSGSYLTFPRFTQSPSLSWTEIAVTQGGLLPTSKAVVAVARKLAVLLHRLWTTQEPYIPFYEAAA
jgi:transposase